MNTKKNNLRKDERAVSPVIGVILMVAITVIMAAVIGAFVYGYSGSMTQTKDIAATARHEGTTIYVTYMGGPDQDLVLDLDAKLGGVAITPDFADTAVGSSVTAVGGGTPPVLPGQGNHVVVIASFSDGTKQVILDTFC